MEEFETGKQARRRTRPTHEPEIVSEFGKLPPQDTSLEDAVLGALMLEKDAYNNVCEILKPEAFYNPANQKIYEAIQTLAANGKPIDMLTVTDQLRSNKVLEEVGGAIRISELTGLVSSAANAEFHARIVAQKYLARELISYSSQVQQLAFDESIDVYDLMQEAEGKLFEISKNTLKRDVIPIENAVQDAIKKIEEAANRESGLSGLESGYHMLDRLTSGWQNSDLIIIAARPAMGKTAFVLSMAKNMAVDYNYPVAVFSLEMSSLQLVNRLISNVCSLEGEKIKSGQLTQPEWENLMTRTRSLSTAPLFIDDTPSLSIFELRTKARRLVREHDVKIIIIYYLQLMNATGMKFGSREQEVSTISRNLKQLAKELDIPIIALSQLNRSVETRRSEDDKTGKRPQLSDLRESGAIEQDADIVCFIHRPEYYTRSSEDAEGHNIKGLAEFIVAKHRSGATDTINLHFVSKFARFENLGEQDIQNSETTVESKMNITPGGPAPAPPAGTGDYPGGPMSPNEAWMPDNNETPPPF